MTSEVQVRRARIEEIRPLAEEYRAESSRHSRDGRPWDPPIPQGGIFWVAEDPDERALGYASGTLRPDGLTIGPVFVRREHRRGGVGFELLRAIQRWAGDTRVPVVEVSVATDNEAGREFLESSGYVPRRILFSLTPERRRPGMARDATIDEDD
ncbi:MAG: GNAT family N-acetyltransferase [Actinobacteria bacterium]|nr:GNAT family N-acetyltransferase [Actinomycetota bacterium]